MNIKMIENLLAILAIVLSQGYKIPQIYKLYKSKSGGDISKRSIIVQSLSYMLWISYSVLDFDIFYLTSNIMSLLLNIIIHSMKYCYAKKEIEIEKRERNKLNI